MRILKPAITIDGDDFVCKSRMIELVPGEYRNFCEREWTASVEIELTYGATGSWTLLKAIEDTALPVTVVIRPSSAVVGTANPSATFSAEIKAVPFMVGATRGEYQTFTLEMKTDDEPVFATA